MIPAISLLIGKTMADMKLTKSEKDDSSLISEQSEESEYPWGLKIHLERHDLAKLGIDLKEVGSTCVFKATAVVTEVEKDVNNPSRKSMGLQIVEMDVNKEESSNAAETLYGKG